MTAAIQHKPFELKPRVRVAGKLELIKQLGEGGMGAVWMARNLTTGADVAIKVLLPERQQSALAAERFRHEAKIGAMLTHRNITRVFDLIEAEDGMLVLVMELLRGGTARTYLHSNGPLTPDQAVAIIVPILSALHHAHGHGIIHRDLKPSNLFLNVEPDGRIIPKLLDFGIAKTEDPSIHTRTGDTLGTPSYMSPEQVRAKGELDGRSDLFSVGVVLYELITGVNPFHASTSSGALAQVLEAEVDPDPRIPPRVWLETKRALSKQVYERHASARELANALSNAVGRNESSFAEGLAGGELALRAEEPDTIVTTVPPERTGRRRPRVRTGVLAALAAASVVLTAVIALQRPADVTQAPAALITQPQTGPATTAESTSAAAPRAPAFAPVQRPAAEPQADPTNAKPGRPLAHATKHAPPPPSPPAPVPTPKPHASGASSLARQPGF